MSANTYMLANEHGSPALASTPARALPAAQAPSSAQAWLRALELTSAIPRNPARVLPDVIEELAAQWGERDALLSNSECMTYQVLAARMHQYARWGLEQGIDHGDTVGLLMTNRPEYMAAWLGIISIGGVVSLLNTNLPGPALAHCIDAVSARHVIVGSECAVQACGALQSLATAPTIWMHGAQDTTFSRIDLEIEKQGSEPLSQRERRPLSIADRALYIYTSGTTGLPKAANVSHARVMQWSHWFAGMMGARPDDRMYNCLPMYHSVGGVVAPGAILIAGGAVVIRERFSVSQFWIDVKRWDCTLFQYIGELCRYLLNTESSATDAEHNLRMACGNGLAPEVWEKFQQRFSIPQILEFYASTEGGVSLFNVQGKRGAIGHVPGYLAHRFAPALVKVDPDKGEPIRNAEGFCIRCAPDEVGEAFGKMVDDASAIGSRFEGYTDQSASERKVLRNAFQVGDAWVRTGDLMRKDAQGYYYFVDRIGDTFRWKGENVATREVAEAICSFSGVKHANVYGVSVPGNDGRAGMATVVTDIPLDLPEFRRHMVNRLPSYARPLFLRIRSEVEVTGTFKYARTDLVRQGFEPTASDDALYFDDHASGTFQILDETAYEHIQQGGLRF